MNTFVYLLPILSVVVLLGSRRANLLQAGIVALLLSVPAAWLALDDSQQLSTVLLSGSLRGIWIAWQAVSIILGGLLLYQVLNTARPDLFAPRLSQTGTVAHHWLFTICFLLGPFVESATGFGVGYLITISALMRMGLGGLHAAAFGLFSQMMVPWGALGVGTYIGAELAGMPVAELGIRGALISAALFTGYLLTFWWMLSRIGQRPHWKQCVDDLLWLGLLCGLLYYANVFVAVDVAGLVCTAPLLIARYFRDRDPQATQNKGSLAQSILPYAVLTVVLVATRVLPPVDRFLRDLLVIQPAADLPRFAIFHHASFWLLVVALGYGAMQLPRHRWPSVFGAVISNAKVPVLVSIVFLMMAEIMSIVGIPAALASAWVASADWAAIAASPVMGIFAGALTASNTASNGMFMLLQVELATRAGADPHWIAAVQNLAGSNAILVSPVRIAMGCALVAMSGRESDIYRLVWPLAVVMLLVLEFVSFVV
jgi:lactate permease